MTASTATTPVTAAQIAEALTAADGNKSAAALLLDLNRSTFTRRLAALAAEVEAIMTAAAEFDEVLEAPSPEDEADLAEIDEALAGRVGEDENTEDAEALEGVGDIDWVPDLPAPSVAMQRMSPAEVALKAPYAVTRTMTENGFGEAEPVVLSPLAVDLLDGLRAEFPEEAGAGQAVGGVDEHASHALLDALASGTARDAQVDELLGTLAAEAAAELAKVAEVVAEDGLHDHCVKCGTPFGHRIAQAVCGSPKMCAKRVELGNPLHGRRVPASAARVAA